MQNKRKSIFSDNKCSEIFFPGVKVGDWTPGVGWLQIDAAIASSTSKKWSWIQSEGLKVARMPRFEKNVLC